MTPNSPWSPYEIHCGSRSSRIVVTCDHASNVIPDAVNGGDLGLPADDMQRHIAYDIGAAGLTKALADRLDAPAVLSNFSRLAIDPNRDPRDPTVLMRLYDGSVIPGNRNADADEKARRIALMHAPYHDAVSDVLAQRDDAIVIAVHSFTRQLRGRPPRPWEAGILYPDQDPRLSLAFLKALRDAGDICVGENQPYKGHLTGDAIDRHALAHGRHNTLIELRNDLIETPDQQAAWADRLAPLLMNAIAETGAL